MLNVSKYPNCMLRHFLSYISQFLLSDNHTLEMRGNLADLGAYGAIDEHAAHGTIPITNRPIMVDFQALDCNPV